MSAESRLHIVPGGLEPLREQRLQLLLGAQPETTRNVIVLGPGAAPRRCEPSARLWLSGLRRWRVGGQLAQAIHRAAPDQVHLWASELLGPFAKALALLAEPPAVLVEFDDGDDATAAARWAEVLATRCAPRWICGSATAQRRLCEHSIPPAQTVVILPAVDFAALRAPERHVVRARLGLADEARALLALPPIARGTGAFYTAWGAFLVQKVHRHLRVIVPGAGPEAERIGRLAGEIRHAEVLITPPSQTPLVDLLAAADLCAFLPERDAPLSAVAWAMAAGRPILASAVPGTTEWLVHGQNAWLCRAGQPRDTARRLLQLLDEPALAARLGQEARTQAFARFGQQRLVEAYQALDTPGVGSARQAQHSPSNCAKRQTS